MWNFKFPITRAGQTNPCTAQLSSAEELRDVVLVLSSCCSNLPHFGFTSARWARGALRSMLQRPVHKAVRSVFHAENIGVLQVGDMFPANIAQLGVAQVRIHETRSGKVRPGEIRSCKITFVHDRSLERGLRQIRAAKIR